MERLRIEGQHRLSGEITVQGAKNSILPLLAGSVLVRGQSAFLHCPRLTDVETSGEILRQCGCRVWWEGDTLLVDAAAVTGCEIPDRLMRQMRSSILFLGSLLGRTGEASFFHPGGCALGSRPIDLHLRAMAQLGAVVQEGGGRMHCKASRLHGTDLVLSFPSVGATENSLLAAVTASGTTRIFNAAREPEIQELAHYLNDCGASIQGAGGDTIVVEGVPRLHGCSYPVMPDRMASATYLAAVAATGGEILLRNSEPKHLRPVLDVLEQSGCTVTVRQSQLYLQAPERLQTPSPIRTLPYPGFPTDAQSPVLAMLLRAEGTTVLEETIFESRFKQVDELRRMGAEIQVMGRIAVVQGVTSLWGTTVIAPDLRGGAGLVIAGLSAEGWTEISGLQRIDRGYVSIETVLSGLGASIQRVTVEEEREMERFR